MTIIIHHSFFRQGCVVTSRGVSKPLEFSLLNWPNEKDSALETGGCSRRLTRSKSWDRMYHVKARQKHNSFFSSNFWIGTEHLILFGRHVFTDVSWFSKLFGTFKLFCVFPAQVSQCNAGHLYRFGKNILRYCYICIGFELCLWSIVGLPGSCTCFLHSALFG